METFNRNQESLTKINKRSNFQLQLESALKSLNISISPVHMEFFPSPPVTRHRSVRRKEEGGMELLGERLFEGGGKQFLVGKTKIFISDIK